MAALDAVAWLALLLLPGMGVARLLRVPGSAVDLAALAAPVTFGISYLLAVALSRAGAPMLPTCLAVLAAIVAAWWAWELRRLRGGGWRRRLARCRDGWRDPVRACSRLLLAAAVLLGVVLWHDLHAALSTPPGWDAMHLGFMTRQIVDHDTLRSSIVLSSDVYLHDGSGFYPLGVNVIAAVEHLAFGTRLSASLLASTVATGGVVLPLGAYSLAARLVGRHSLLPGFAALAAVVPATLFTISYLGRITAIVGIALVASTTCALLASRERPRVGTAAVGAFALIGIVVTHTSELPVVVGLALVVLVVDAIRRRGVPLGRWLAALAGAAAGGALLLVLADPSVLHAAGTRTGAFVHPNGGSATVREAIRTVAELGVRWTPADAVMHAWTLLALAGCLVPLHPRWRGAAPASLAYLGFGAFFVAWDTGHLGPLLVLGDPWYRDTGRISWELVALGAIPVGLALSAAAAALTWCLRLPVRAPRWSALAVVAGTAAAALAFGVSTVPDTATESQWLRANAAPVDAHARAAFGYLAGHVKPGDRVLDDLEAHGDLWMYTDYGVATMFGNPPAIGAAPASWKERLYLRGRFAQVDGDPCVPYLLRKYRAQYVYYSGRKMVDGTVHITLRALSSSPYFRQVFRSGSSRVFAVRNLPAAPSCDRNLTTQYPWSTLHNAK